MSLFRKKYYLFIIITLFGLVSMYFYSLNSNVQIYTQPKIQTIPTEDTQHPETIEINPNPKTEITNTKGYTMGADFRINPIDSNDNKKVVLLTIDDGPSRQSVQILDILDKHNVKAIFFINGTHHKANPSVIDEEFKRGHSIGNHTWSHQNLKQISEEKAKQEIDSNTKIIFETTGENPKFFRAPYGINSDFSRSYVKSQSMLSMNWSASPKDWEKPAHDKKVFVENVMKTLHNGDIILMHENTWSRDALEDLILAIQSKGYTFLDPKEITQ